MMKLKKSTQVSGKGTVLVLCGTGESMEAPGLLAEGHEWLSSKKKEEFGSVQYQQFDRLYIFCFMPSGAPDSKTLEKARKAGSEAVDRAREFGHSDLNILNKTGHPGLSLACAEGCLLAAYTFTKYLKAPKEEKLKRLQVVDPDVKAGRIEELNLLTQSVYLSRDLVNEPQNYLNATQLATEIKRAGKTYGFKVEVFNKKKIESLKMGGLLAVNQGSPQPPTFSILEWKPEKAVNKNPLVLVGKGVVYDTGGLSLKPTPNSMDMMKCDMAGAAAVIGAISAVSANKLPVHVIALVPASDNRPGQDAYAPGDIIKMFDGTSVEVLNTDAEGRLLLADALSYAKKYKPELVLEASTLTGAAVRAIGEIGIAVMGTAGEIPFKALKTSGEHTYERVVEFPMWEEYGEEIKSKIADLKNLGGPYAGQIHAGMFLTHFTDYPFIHCDIAGPAYLGARKAYLPPGGTGTGVRLFYDFIKRYYSL